MVASGRLSKLQGRFGPSPFPAVLAAVLAALLVACSGDDASSTSGKADAGKGDASTGFGNPMPLRDSAVAPWDADIPPLEAPCRGLACQQTSCTAGACTQQPCATGKSTTVTGTVYEPAGKIPLYNVMVFVPDGKPAKFKSGASCDRCSLMQERPVVSAITNTKGRFVLKDVPVGDDIPLVIQIGKWRRQIEIPKVRACAETKLTDLAKTRLPRNKKEGDIPLIAISTGGADSMECLPRRLGIDASEFTTEDGDGRIHLYSGADNGTDHSTKAFDADHNAGATLTRSTVLWGSVETLEKYDMVILSCEGATIENEKPESARKALYDYAKLGGRVFASHWHRFWFSDGPDPVPEVGTWSDRDNPSNPSTGTINTSFPKGKALAQWLVNVNATPTLGEIEIQEPRDNVQAVDPMYATEWITVQNSAGKYAAQPTAVQYLSFNAPLTGPDEAQCGRVVFTDLHVSSTGDDQPGNPFPGSCEDRDLSSQEKAVAFMLFDLSACVIPDDEPPAPPPPVLE